MLGVVFMYVLAHRTSPCRGTRAKSRDKPAQASSTGVVVLDIAIVPCVAARVEYLIQRSFAFVIAGYYKIHPVSCKYE